jgi:hypothetical protein
MDRGQRHVSVSLCPLHSLLLTCMRNTSLQLAFWYLVMTCVSVSSWLSFSCIEMPSVRVYFNGLDRRHPSTFGVDCASTVPNRISACFVNKTKSYPFVWKVRHLVTSPPAVLGIIFGFFLWLDPREFCPTARADKHITQSVGHTGFRLGWGSGVRRRGDTMVQPVTENEVTVHFMP